MSFLCFASKHDTTCFAVVLSLVSRPTNRVFSIDILQVNKSLTSLDIRYNSISTLPPAILPALRRLKKFECSDNPWTNPPEEVMNRGLAAIIQFMSRLKAEGKQTCNLAMLAILGKGEVLTGSSVLKVTKF